MRERYYYTKGLQNYDKNISTKKYDKKLGQDNYHKIVIWIDNDKTQKKSFTIFHYTIHKY